MNIGFTTNYQNKPNFTAFNRPSDAVLNHFRKAASELTPQARAEFVENMGKIVKSAENNPVPIRHSLDRTTSQVYIASVGNKIYLSKNGNPANAILQTMKAAVEAANDLHNLNKTTDGIKKIFGM